MVKQMVAVQEEWVAKKMPAVVVLVERWSRRCRRFTRYGRSRRWEPRGRRRLGRDSGTGGVGARELEVREEPAARALKAVKAGRSGRKPSRIAGL